MATAKIEVTEGAGTNIATHSITEDATTKHLTRHVPQDSAGAEIFGSKTDAKNTATDTTSVSAISIWKQISDSVQSLVTNAVTQVAHDASDASTLPIKVGYKATTSLAGLTLVADADRTNGFAGIDGVQIVRPHCNLEDVVSGVSTVTDGSSTSTIAAQGAGVKTYVTTVIISNTSATAVTVDLRDGAAGTVKATFPVPANTSGVVCNLPVPLGFSANTAVCADPSAAASSIITTLIGFKSKV